MSSTPNKGAGRVIVFGMDGADPELIFAWAREGHLPNLGGMMREGAHARLESTIHPLTPQAWTSMVTGVNPGRHGIFDFGARREGSYEIDLVTSRHRAFPTIFETLTESLSCGVLNLPLSFPVDPIRGFALGGMHTPALETPGAMYPPGLLSASEPYSIDVMAHWYEDKERFVADVHEMSATRHKTFLRLFDTRKPDVFFAVYVALDRVQHALWSEMTRSHRAAPGSLGGPGDEIFRCAKALDDCLGDYLDRLGPKDHLLLVSDHGFGDLRGDVYPNTWLAERGDLRFDSAKVRAYRPPRTQSSGDPRHAWQHRLRAHDPAPLPSSDEDIRAGRMDPLYKTWETVDWPRTRAYASGLFGNLWINLRGREPQGALEPGREYELARDELLEGLEGLRHPVDGEKLLSYAARREELYWGSCLHRAPDIIAVFQDYALMTRGATEFLGESLVGPVEVGHTGNHRLHGIAVLHGPEAAKGKAPDGKIMEIAPTILHLAGAPIPKNLDATKPSALLSEAALKERPPILGPPSSPRGAPAPEIPSPDMEEVVKRLHGLGYLA